MSLIPLAPRPSSRRPRIPALTMGLGVTGDAVDVDFSQLQEPEEDSVRDEWPS